MSETLTAPFINATSLANASLNRPPGRCCCRFRSSPVQFRAGRFMWHEPRMRAPGLLRIARLNAPSMNTSVTSRVTEATAPAILATRATGLRNPTWT